MNIAISDSAKLKATVGLLACLCVLSMLYALASKSGLGLHKARYWRALDAEEVGGGRR